MPWTKMKIPGSSSLLKDILTRIKTYVTDPEIHGNDAWTLVRDEEWPYGTVFKVPNYHDGEYGYMGLMTADIRVGSSYWNWLRQPDVFRRWFVLHKNGLGLDANSDFSVGDGIVITNSRIKKEVTVGERNGKEVKSDNYLFPSKKLYSFETTPEIFASDANVLFFTMFKQYQKNFDWLDLMGNERRSIQLKPLKYSYKGQGSPSLFDPPLYPGVGAPAIGCSPDFFDSPLGECSQDSEENTVALYLCKNRHRLMIVVNYRERWDVASVGFFEPFDTNAEYSFPAMAVGATSGVLPLAELVSDLSGPPHVEHGFRLDYTESNWSLSHGFPTFASSWWDGTTDFLDRSLYSQVQAMLPDGNWQSFANFGLAQDAYYNKQMNLFFSGHKEPQRLPGSRYFLTPNFTDISKVRGLLPTGVTSAEIPDAPINLVNRSDCQLAPLYFVQRTEDNIDQNIIGRINNMYWCSQPVTRYGEYEIDGKTYLIIPNGWERRKYHIKHFFGALIGESQSAEHQLKEMKRLDELSRAMNCAIQLDC